jgi:hypothetical protein
MDHVGVCEEAGGEGWAPSKGHALKLSRVHIALETCGRYEHLQPNTHASSKHERTHPFTNVLDLGPRLAEDDGHVRLHALLSSQNLLDRSQLLIFVTTPNLFESCGMCAHTKWVV